MIIPKKNRHEICKYLFQEGVLYAKKDFNLEKHPEIDVPNLQVIKLMQSFKSKEYVRETFAWMYHYWYLTNDGIEFLRTFLNLPSEIVPATLKKSAKPPSCPFGSGPPGDRPRGPPRFEGDRPRFGDREGYRGGPRSGGDFGDKGGAPPEFQPSFRVGCKNLKLVGEILRLPRTISDLRVVKITGNYSKVAHLWQLEGAKERLQLVKADLMEEGSFDNAVMGCEGVLHTASPVHGAKSDPKSEILDPAINGTLNVLRSCKKNPALRRVVLTSSSSTVRICTRENIDPKVPLDESSWSSVKSFRYTGRGIQNSKPVSRLIQGAPSLKQGLQILLTRAFLATSETS